MQLRLKLAVAGSYHNSNELLFQQKQQQLYNLKIGVSLLLILVLAPQILGILQIFSYLKN